jgi:PadR family transcriptional regulator PadR
MSRGPLPHPLRGRPRRSGADGQTRGAWHHGYDLCRQAEIKSGTLCPLLMRLAAQGYLEAEWQAPQEPGRPARHAYRLTAAGRQLAREIAPRPAIIRGHHTKLPSVTNLVCAAPSLARRGRTPRRAHRELGDVSPEPLAARQSQMICSPVQHRLPPVADMGLRAILAAASAKPGGKTWRGEKPGRRDAQQGFSRPPGTTDRYRPGQ